ncbi:MAG: hypothetical protein Kow00109_22090 [Acidobacteriota bacterium]
MKVWGIAPAVVALAAGGFSQELGESYRQVDSVDWVVRDLHGVVSGWRSLGFPAEVLGERVIQVGTESGRVGEERVLLGWGRWDRFRIVWIQPLAGGSLWSEGLRRRGEGVFSLNHACTGREELDREAAEWRVKGVSVEGRVSWEQDPGGRHTVYLDTEPQGRIRLALVIWDDGPEFPAGELPAGLRSSQYAFVVRRLEPISAVWEGWGWPAFDISYGPLRDLVHRGRPGRFEQRLGWQRHGDIVYEWIEPTRGPTVYEEALAAHGEGFHHFAFDVPDMDAAIRHFTTRGYEVTQAGAWGEAGKPGSGRFAYIGTERLGGVTIELLWNFPGGN